MNRPPGVAKEKLPRWISRDLIEETLAVWQPFYGFSLTERDAIEILLDVGRLFDDLGGSDGEAIPGAGESLQP
jgi:hypothetical protein